MNYYFLNKKLRFHKKNSFPGRGKKLSNKVAHVNEHSSSFHDKLRSYETTLYIRFYKRTLREKPHNEGGKLPL